VIVTLHEAIADFDHDRRRIVTPELACVGDQGLRRAFW